MTTRSKRFPLEAAPLAIDKQSRMPLYAQLKEQLARLLTDGTPRRQFFTDSQLTEMFKVSRTTVREAVRELIQDGYLYRVRGVGTFVAAQKMSARLDRLQSHFKAWTAQGKVVSTEVKAGKWAKCPGWAASLLGVAEASKVFYVHRVRAADGVPIASDYRYLPEQSARYVSADALQSKMIFEILAEKMPGDPPRSARFTIEAAGATPQDAQALRISEGTPVLVRTHVLVSQTGRALSAGKSIFRADLTKWSIDLPLVSEREVPAGR